MSNRRPSESATMPFLVFEGDHLGQDREAIPHKLGLYVLYLSTCVQLYIKIPIIHELVDSGNIRKAFHAQQFPQSTACLHPEVQTREEFEYVPLRLVPIA